MGSIRRWWLNHKTHSSIENSITSFAFQIFLGRDIPSLDVIYGDSRSQPSFQIVSAEAKRSDFDESFSLNTTGLVLAYFMISEKRLTPSFFFARQLRK